MTLRPKLKHFKECFFLNFVTSALLGKNVDSDELSVKRRYLPGATAGGLSLLDRNQPELNKVGVACVKNFRDINS